MQGTLSTKGLKTEIFYLTIYDILGHFDVIDQVTFTPAEETNNSYFDVVKQAYLEASISDKERDKFLIKDFHERIKELFSDRTPKIIDKLKELGATDVDFALINHDKVVLEKIAFENTETDIYQLAKIYRFVDIAAHINPSFKPFEIHITIGHTPITLGSLNYQAFEYDSGAMVQHNAFINIQDAGNKTWNYNHAAFWNKNIKNFFDTSILFGNASKYLLDEEVFSFFHTKEISQLTTKNLNFVLVIINMHDSEESGKLSSVFGKFPQLAKETLYVVQSCYSGKYHQTLPNGCHLITSSGAEESSLTWDFDKVSNLAKYMSNSGLDLATFLQFYASEYTKSTPYFSGVFGNKLIQKAAIKTIAQPEVRIELLDEIQEEKDNFVQEVSERKMQVNTFPVYLEPQLHHIHPASASPHGESHHLLLPSNEDLPLLGNEVSPYDDDSSNSCCPCVIL